MIKLGKIQNLIVDKKSEYGIYLKEDLESKESVLLPNKEVPEDINIGDKIEVFIYKDSDDRIIATTKKPKIQVGEIGFLKVVDKTKIGAFLDIGLDKDILLPFKEQKTDVHVNKEYIVGLYIDKSKRLCASMDLSFILDSNSPYKKGDKVNGIIYNINEYGVFVAVDNKFIARIPTHEIFNQLKVGDEIEAFITNVKSDGKLDLSLRDKAYKLIDKDKELILNKLLENGELKLNDKSSPEEIKSELGISKNAFKRAVGRLLKENKIYFENNKIKLK